MYYDCNRNKAILEKDDNKIVVDIERLNKLSISYFIQYTRKALSI